MSVSPKLKLDEDKILNAFTVDLEDWYQGIELPLQSWKNYTSRIEVGLHRILELLDKYRVRATFFVLGWMAERYPGLVKEVAVRGHELGSHGLSHEKVYHLSAEAFRQDVRTTRQLLQDLSGQPVVTHRSPFFSITPGCLWALKVLSEEGFTIDCSISPVKTWRYGIKSCPDEIYNITDSGITEFPVSTFNILNRRWVIGGAYFRILPYLFTRRGFYKRQIEGKCTMFYIHPWEYDTDHPGAPMEWKARLTHYARLHQTSPHTERLLKDFRFDNVSRVVENYAAKHSIRNITTDLLKD